MKTIGTDGKEHLINPKINSRDCDELFRSNLHKKARLIIQKCLPYCTIYEEVTLTGCKGTSGYLVADFMVPSIPMIIEVHGEQHYKYSKFFHKSEEQYKEYLQNDSIKKEWAISNNIIYIELPFNLESKWTKIIYEHLE